MTQATIKPNITTLGDLLKSEADTHSRDVINAPKGTKIGDVITHPAYSFKLVALSDEKNNKVLIQPRNCTINIDYVNLGETSLSELISAGMQYGIDYRTTAGVLVTTQNQDSIKIGLSAPKNPTPHSTSRPSPPTSGSIDVSEPVVLPPVLDGRASRGRPKRENTVSGDVGLDE